MKRCQIPVIVLLLLCSVTAVAQTNKYDAKLADSLGGTAQGMKMYSFVLLKTGPAKVEDKKVRDSLFRTHFSNMDKLVKAGKLIIAGPFEKNEQGFRGLFIINAKGEEIPALLEGDGAIRSGILQTEIYSWYGSAALPMYLQYHEKITKSN